MLNILKKHPEQKKLIGKTALITGASRGIGAAVTKSFAAEGAHVLLLARTSGAMEELDDQIQSAGGAATIIPFDLSNTNHIGALGPAILQKCGKLDILVANAAQLGPLSPVAQSDASAFEETFKVNFFANYHLIRALDPLLRASPNGRAIFVTSEAAHLAAPFWSAYAASKIALESLIMTYAMETMQSNLKVNLVDPGEVDTDMHAEAFPSALRSDYKSPETITGTFLDLAVDDCKKTGTIFRVR